MGMALRMAPASSARFIINSTWASIRPMSERLPESSWASRSSARAAGRSPASILASASWILRSQGLGRYSSSSWRMVVSGWAPWKALTGWPSFITTTVGRLRMPNWAVISCCWSALTLASRKAPLYSAASFSRRGISALQGAHQSAQKSTSTGRTRDSSIRYCWAFCRVMSTTWGFIAGSRWFRVGWIMPRSVGHGHRAAAPGDGKGKVGKGQEAGKRRPRPRRGGGAAPVSDKAHGGHGAGHLHEAADVGARHVVAGHAEFLGGLEAVVVDVDHDLPEALFSVLEGPGVAAGILLHLQGAGGNAPGVGGLAGAIGDAGGLEDLDAFRGGGHVGAFGDGDAAVLHQGLGV